MASMLQSGFPSGFTIPGFPPGFLIGSQLANGFGFPDLSASQASQAAPIALPFSSAQPQLFSSAPVFPIGGQLSGGFGFPDLSGLIPSAQDAGFAGQPSLFGGASGAFPSFQPSGQSPPLLMNFGAPVGTPNFGGLAQSAGIPSISASMFGPPVGSMPSFGAFGDAFQFPFLGGSQQAPVATPFGSMPSLFSNIQSPFSGLASTLGGSQLPFGDIGSLFSGISSPTPSPFFGSLPAMGNMFGNTTQSLMQLLSPMLSLVGIR